MDKKVILVILLCLTTAVVALPFGLTQDIASSSVDVHGPYVDTVVWKIIQVEETAILALAKGEVDLYNERVPAELLGKLLGEPGVFVNRTMGTYFRHVSFNCDKFPTNYTAVRVAIAQATDKWKIVDEATLGLAMVSDTPVPPVYELYSIEEEFLTHYYDPDPVSANATLDAAGFLDIDDDGWREGPGGEEINIVIDTSDYPPAMSTCYVIEEGAESVGLQVEVNVIEWELLQTRFETGVFDATVFSWGCGIPDPDHLYDFFRTGNPYNELITRFHNATYDAAADALYTAKTLEDALAAAAECQRIFFEQQPLIVAYVDSLSHAMRTDVWEGWQIVKGRGWVESEWTLYKVRLKEEAGGPLGGTVTVAQPEPLKSTNILTTDDGYTYDVFDLVYQPLWEIDPITWQDIPGKGLAESWTIEETTDPEGLKLTFDLIENATWHDGQPVTSEDVKFTIELIQHSGAPYRVDFLSSVYDVTTPDNQTVVIYSNQTGIFTFHRIQSGLPWILPKHIWEPHWDDALTWVPEVPTDVVGSGPFKFTEHVEGEYMVLEKYDKWPYLPTTTSAVSVSVDPGSVDEGGTFGVTATVDNTGIVAFTDVEVTITLPAGTSLASGTATQTIDRIPPGESRSVTWVVTGETAETYSITVDAESTQFSGEGTGTVQVSAAMTMYYVAGAVIAAIVIVGGYFLLRRS